MRSGPRESSSPDQVCEIPPREDMLSETFTDTKMLWHYLLDECGVDERLLFFDWEDKDRLCCDIDDIDLYTVSEDGVIRLTEKAVDFIIEYNQL